MTSPSESTPLGATGPSQSTPFRPKPSQFKPFRPKPFQSKPFQSKPFQSNPFDRVVARVLQRKWVPPSAAQGDSPTAARTRSTVQAMCHCTMAPDRVTALAVDVPAYRRELTDAIDEVLRGYLPMRAAPVVHQTRPVPRMRMDPHLAGTPLETYARLLRHDTMSPLRFGPEEVRAYAINVLDSIRTTWPKRSDREEALRSMGRVATQAADSAELDRTARTLARELSLVFTDQVDDTDDVDGGTDTLDSPGSSLDEETGTVDGRHVSNAGREWMDAAAEDMRRRTGSLRGAVGPAWTRGEVEAPAGERDMGTWKAAVYTDEQKHRLAIDSDGNPYASEGQ